MLGADHRPPRALTRARHSGPRVLACRHRLPMNAPAPPRTPFPSRGGAGLLASFRHAWTGLIHTVVHQRNMRVHLVSAVLVGLVGSGIPLGLAEKVTLIFCVLLIFFAEILNSALEHLVDLAVQQFDEKARLAKDAAAAGVMVLALGTVVIFAALLVHNWERRAQQRPADRPAGGARPAAHRLRHAARAAAPPARLGGPGRLRRGRGAAGAAGVRAPPAPSSPRSPPGCSWSPGRRGAHPAARGARAKKNRLAAGLATTPRGREPRNLSGARSPARLVRAILRA